MAKRVVEEASLRPTAQPVDRFAAPQMERAGDSGLTELAKTLQRVNPRLQNFLLSENNENAKAQEAEGAMAESNIDQSITLAQNKEGWNQLLRQARKENPEMAETLTGSSPHFRRGLVKARAERLGRGLQQHLSDLWNDNVGGIQSIDSMETVEQWVQEQAQAYGERVGINDIDPVIANDSYLPFVSRAQDRLIGHHTEYRAKARVEGYKRELNANVGLLTLGGDVGDSPVDSFLGRLTGSESGGNAGAFRTNKDGRQFGGLVQMGQARLNEWADATGNDRITVSEYKAMNESQQLAVARWHIRDIDKTIDAEGFLAKGWSRDGLRAVAHLGGKEGMRDFVMTHGTSDPYNPSDELGTHLSDYYTKFSSQAAGLQKTVDEAVGDGLDPKEVNETVVMGVITQARAAGKPEMMDVLMDINTGSGPLGNIGWVREEVLDAKDEIETDNYQEDQRERQREKWEDEDRRETYQIEGWAMVMNDPRGDHSDFIAQVRDSGFPDLATRMMNLQQTLQDRDRQIETDHNYVMEVRREIMSGETGREELMDMIVGGVRDGRFSSNEGQSLMSYLDRDSKAVDYASDGRVIRSIQEAAMVVEESFKGSGMLQSITGTDMAKARQKALEFENEMYDELEVFLEDNPEASTARVRKFMRDTAEKVAKSDRYQPVEQEMPETVLDGESSGGSGQGSRPPGTGGGSSDDSGGGGFWNWLTGGGEEEQDLEAARKEYMDETQTFITMEEFKASLEGGE